MFAAAANNAAANRRSTQIAPLRRRVMWAMAPPKTAQHNELAIDTPISNASMADSRTWAAVAAAATTTTRIQLLGLSHCSRTRLALPIALEVAAVVRPAQIHCRTANIPSASDPPAAIHASRCSINSNPASLATTASMMALPRAIARMAGIVARSPRDVAWAMTMKLFGPGESVGTAMIAAKDASCSMRIE